MLKRLILVMNLIEYILQVQFFGLQFRIRVFYVCIRNAINSFIKNKVSIATSFINSILLFILVLIVNIIIVEIRSSVRTTLATKAFFFQILNAEMFHRCVIELKPFAIVLGIWISFFNIAVIVAGVC
jgi:hypothetical protein